MTISRIQIALLLLLTALAWATCLLGMGIPITPAHALPFSTVLGFLAFLSLATEHWLWRKKWLHEWLFQRPDLRGTWRVTINSSYAEGKAQSVVGFLGVTQTLGRLQMHLMTEESESWLVAHSIVASPNGCGYRIYGVYTNSPGTLHRSVSSEIHNGALVLDAHGTQALLPIELTGEYFTDRGTKGVIGVADRKPQVYTHFHACIQGFR